MALALICDSRTAANSTTSTFPLPQRQLWRYPATYLIWRRLALNWKPDQAAVAQQTASSSSITCTSSRRLKLMPTYIAIPKSQQHTLFNYSTFSWMLFLESSTSTRDSTILVSQHLNRDFTDHPHLHNVNPLIHRLKPSWHVKLAKNQTTCRRTRAARTIILDHKFAPFLLPGIVLANPIKKFLRTSCCRTRL